MKHHKFDDTAVVLAGSNSAKQFLAPIFSERDQELMVVAHCDICLRLVELLIFPGCRAFVRVSISEIFRRAIPGGGLILAHNHPSGKIEPSPADLNLTKRVHLVAEALEIVLLDHLIIGAEAMFSFRRAGLI